MKDAIRKGELKADDADGIKKLRASVHRIHDVSPVADNEEALRQRRLSCCSGHGTAVTSTRTSGPSPTQQFASALSKSRIIRPTL